MSFCFLVLSSAGSYVFGQGYIYTYNKASDGLSQNVDIIWAVSCEKVSDYGIHYPLTDSEHITEYINGEQRLKVDNTANNQALPKKRTLQCGNAWLLVNYILQMILKLYCRKSNNKIYSKKKRISYSVSLLCTLQL